MNQNASLAFFHSYAEEHQWIEDAIRAEARPSQVLRVLEAGCGQRWFANLPDIKLHLTGVDQDAAALDIRKRVHADLDEAILGDLMTVQLPSGAFDIAYNAFVLEHVQDPERLLLNLVHWLKPGGLLVLRIPDRQSVKGFLTHMTPHWFHVLYYRVYKKNPNAGKPGHMPYPTPFGKVVSRVGLNAFCQRHGLQAVAERARSSQVDDNGLLYQSILQLGKLLSFGRLKAEYSDLCMLIRKPGGTQA